MPYGKKYSVHMPFGKGLGQCNITLCRMARSIPGTCLLARARGNAIVLLPAFVSRKYLSVQLLTPFTTRRRRNNPANIRMQEKRRLARHHQHKASLVEEELRLDNAVITDARPGPR
jgi:hypothetical protein